jgi:hypothetical protein
MAALARREKPRRATLPGMAAANYYPVIFRAVSGLPSNTHAARLGLYGQARKALAAQPLSKRELNYAIFQNSEDQAYSNDDAYLRSLVTIGKHVI